MHNNFLEMSYSLYDTKLIFFLVRGMEEMMKSHTLFCDATKNSIFGNSCAYYSWASYTILNGTDYATSTGKETLVTNVPNSESILIG